MLKSQGKMNVIMPIIFIMLNLVGGLSTNNSGGITQSFTTTNIFTFASMGDAQAATANFTATVNQIASLNPDLVIFSGDLETNGVLSAEMKPMIAALKNANLFNKTFLVRGNHDNHQTGSAGLWESYFETAPNIKTLPAGVTDYVPIDSNSDYLTYSYVYGNSMFVGLDVPWTADALTSTQVNWLDTRLTYAESQGLTHAFIYFHGPMYCVESNHCECSSRTDASCTPSALVPVINKHPIISAFFHGHEHILGWTHMDNTRVAGLTGNFEQFITSPSGGWTYNSYIFPARMDYFYPDMESSQGFATVSVNGSSFTFNAYKVGTTTPVWSRTFTKGATPKAITAFSFASPAATGTINEGAHTIAVTVPYGTNVTALVASFTTTGASVKVGNTAQVSGTTPNNFSSPVTYTVTADDASTQDYVVTVATSSTTTTTFNPPSDGWVLESSENSSKGGSTNSTAKTLRLGDDAAKKQYCSILSFNTGASLPDNAVITKVTLKVRRQGVTGGGNPITTFQGFLVDIKKGYFGTRAWLQTSDFQSAASKSGLGPFKPALSSGWYSIDLSSGKAYINTLASRNGLTQIRLRFKLDDNSNTVANYLSLYSGNASSPYRPQLVIEYHMP
jgi:hypothetical protein